ncbi:MAG: ribonuclease III [Phycisphaerae bacterium]|nr:ribonuclease III [Phycisphaerae bacterium]
MDDQMREQLQELLDYRFQNPAILDEALTHSSLADSRLLSNERLEFLGDSILALVICKTLFTRFPEYLEGDLTKIKSMLVSRKTCAWLAAQMGLQNFAHVGKGMEKTRAMSGSIAAGILEAVIAAICLDGGFEHAERFILRIYGPLIDQADAQQHQENFKSLLQQHAQQTQNQTPLYEVLDEKGPDHNKCFEVCVVIARQRYPSAWGVTKKDAEQKAAKNALTRLGLLEAEDRTATR